MLGLGRRSCHAITRFTLIQTQIWRIVTRKTRRLRAILAGTSRHALAGVRDASLRRPTAEDGEQVTNLYVNLVGRLCRLGNFGAEEFRVSLSQPLCSLLHRGFRRVQPDRHLRIARRLEHSPFVGRRHKADANRRGRVLPWPWTFLKCLGPRRTRLTSQSPHPWNLPARRMSS